MAPTRGGRDVERGGQYFPPGVVMDMEGNPLGTPEGLGLDGGTAVRPGRNPRRPGLLGRGLRGLGNRLLGNG